jgi:geranylgeranyl pyrophosphate synthase
MDNDDVRRGRATTHKKFGEWNAILTGDLLLNLSYQLIFSIRNLSEKELQMLGKIFSHSLGGKGLIHGQYLDLSKEMNSSLDSLILTHKLKTARLIQVALIGGAILSGHSENSELKKIAKLGENIGIIFQLLDDLSELKDKNHR